MKTLKQGKLGPTDYAFLFGMPVAFLLLAIWGIRSLIGPPPPTNPMPALRSGEIKAGMTATQVLDKLGAPNEKTEKEDGSVELRYTRTDWSGVARERNTTLTQDEGIVVIGPDGRVLTVRFEQIPVPAPEP